MEQAFTAQNRGLLTMRGRLVLGHHPRLVLGGEATPGRPWRRIDRPRPVLLGRLLVAAHVRISSHALQANPDRRGVSQQPDREGAGARSLTSLPTDSTSPAHGQSAGGAPPGGLLVNQSELRALCLTARPAHLGVCATAGPLGQESLSGNLW